MGDVDANIICTNYNITESGSRSSKDSYYYQQFGASVAFVCPDNYVLDDWVTIAIIESTYAGSISGTFELAPNNWAGSLYVSIDWDAGGSSTAYNPALVTGACDDTPIPTIVYDLVWTGASGFPEYWDWADNWETTCGSVGSIPNTGDNCIIPVVSNGNYPSLINDVTGMGIHQPTCDYLRINSGASLSTDDLDNEGPDQVTYTINNDMAIYGTLTIIPDGQLTVDGATYLDAAECLIIQATTDGTGSFIDNSTITYGASGTAKVQTYLTNSAGAGNFYIHLVGPTVDEENYSGTGTGADLGAFILGGVNTWAYEWDETLPSSSGWQNINSLTYEVRTADGIGLSTDDNTAHTIEMTGALMTDNISSPAYTQQ